MKKFLTVILVSISVYAYAATMVCETISGQKFIWTGNSCPAGSIFVSF